VAHKQYRGLAVEDICRKVVKAGCFIDVKSGFDEPALQAAGLKVWRL
jgi:UDP-N-acetyl-D-glucosamine/UDP-N-acetyl-D-galactosamine dehydrogenase